MTNNPPQTNIQAQQAKNNHITIPVTYLFNAYPYPNLDPKTKKFGPLSIVPNAILFTKTNVITKTSNQGTGGKGKAGGTVTVKVEPWATNEKGVLESLPSDFDLIRIQVKLKRTDLAGSEVEPETD